MMKKLSNLLAASLVSLFTTLGLVYALTPIIPSIPFSFSNGQVINPTQMNQNFSTLQTDVNAFQTNGSWTPADTSGAGLSFTNVSAGYTQIGNMVFAYGRLTYPANANGSSAQFGPLPFGVPSSNYATQCALTWNNGGPTPLSLVPIASSTNVGLFSSLTQYVNSGLGGTTLVFNCIYPAS